MSLIDDLNQEISRYNSLKENIKDISNELRVACDNLNSAISNLNKNFTIDGMIADNGKMNLIKSIIEQEELSKINEINSSIDEKISYCHAKIDEENARIEEERRAAEEAEAQRRALEAEKLKNALSEKEN